MDSIDDEDDGDECEICGVRTDSIMQAPNGSGYDYVCETCLNRLEQNSFGA